MKYEINEKDLKFTPFSLTIKIESRDELMELWHKLSYNLDSIEMKDYEGRFYYPPTESEDILNFWQELNKIASTNDLKYK